MFSLKNGNVVKI